MASHPTTDKNLPSYQHPAYVDMQPELDLIANLWNDLKDCKARYLPQENAEPARAYQNRLTRTQFDNRFNSAIAGFAGLLSAIDFTDEVPQSIRDAEKNIDLQGNDSTTFWTEATQKALKDGGCGVLVDFQPEDPTIFTNIDLLKSGRRPYLVLIDRRDILSWKISYPGGKPRIDRVVIRETRLEDDGEFGVETKLYYRVLMPGYFQVWELIQSKNGFTKLLVDEGETSLNEVPLRWYSPFENNWFTSKPPFLNLARLNIEHLQKRSSLNEVLHKCNLPVPVRKGLIRAGVDQQQIPKLTIGPNSLVDVPVDGEFYFAEPTGSAIAATQADIEKLEKSMDRVSLAFLTGGDAQKTATEVVLTTAQTQATLKGMARRLESCSQEVFRLWTAYTGEKTIGSLDVDEKILQLPLSAQDAQIILDAMGLQISRETGLKMLQQRRWLPDDTDLEKEAQMAEPQGKSLVSSSAIAAEQNSLPGIARAL
jgi:hypothetical protein